MVLCAYAAPLTAASPTPHGTAAPAAPPIGTRDTVTAGPRVPRPPGTPCVQELFRDAEATAPGPFWIFEAQMRDFVYEPPAGCSGPWSKVVLKIEFRNADPSASLDGAVLAHLSIDGVPLFSGGAQYNDVPTYWRAERDVTDYSAVLGTSGVGLVEMRGRTRYGEFNSPYYASATLLFYPPDASSPAPRVPDAVHPLSADAWHDVGTPDDQLAASLTLPRNVERAYLDVMAQARFGDDLFWFTCMADQAMARFPELASRLAIGPNRVGLDVNQQPQGCSGGSFRELQVSIDGQPAGLAPIYPKVHPLLNPVWNSTRLFQPAPAPLALNFMPYRIDLTPFAGLLSDGAPHQVALSVASGGDIADFHLSGTLLIYRDPGASQVVGLVTRNTLAGQVHAPDVTSTLERNGSGEVSGQVTTTSHRNYVIEGYADTSRGRVHSTVERTLSFENLLVPYAYDPSGTDADAYRLDLDLESVAKGTSRRYLDGDLVAEDRELVRYPLTLAYAIRPGAEAPQHERWVDLQQAFSQRTDRQRPGVERYRTRLDHEVDLAFAPDLDYTGDQTRWNGMQRYVFRDSHSSCYRIDLATQDGMLSDYRPGAGCPGGVNRLYWASHPDGSPDGPGWTEH
ncbi:peptide-N4-asparagine amidase [Luteimonas sp. R10]|uniref:peptide-N4-asparagine amidase n=1 Tax=Luteimonas sp. R10 TaxID=3108176 RepID=UPI003091FDA7|nr:peptide-N4-asparagine amidase [Luteimonas sp. R10]